MNRIVQLPAGLSPSSSIFLAALIQRNQQTDAQAKIFLGRNFAYNGDPPDSYVQIASIKGFAWHGVLMADFLAAAVETAVGNTLPTLPPGAPTASPFPLVAGMEVQLDGPDVILDETTDFDSICGTLLVFVDDEIMSISEAGLNAVGNYSLTVVRGFYGTAIADHLNGSQVFIMRASGILPVAHPYFQDGNECLFKVTVGAASISDAIPFTFIVADGAGDPDVPTLSSIDPNAATAAIPNNYTLTGTNLTSATEVVPLDSSGNPIVLGYTVAFDVVDDSTITFTWIYGAGVYGFRVATIYGTASLQSCLTLS